ncbi:DUF4189 domain-containing protein [Nocardia inohanensis]|uniref:DUF4189 domain-containing protein n=1 Tax=Nocardia inohanensis TaxID=209246 RepID=UPI0008316C07|nr:DUF4189 domain-containing protein [Nocardia inohanensis]
MSMRGKTALGILTAAAALLLPATAQADGNVHGAMAVSFYRGDPVIGIATDASDQASADRIAIQRCGHFSCLVQVQFVNGCGAIATRGSNYASAVGATRAEAERKALEATGTDPHPILAGIGVVRKSEAKLVSSECTGNAS